MQRLARLSRVQNPSQLRKNLDSIAGYLVKIVLGSNADSNTFKGKTLRINLRVGWLIASACGSASAKLAFEALSVEQI